MRGVLKPKGLTRSETVWGDSDAHYETNTSGAVAVAVAMKDMGALTSLNLSSNDLKAEGAKIVAEAIRVTCHCGRFVTVFMPI
jgi:hypothetical protein